MMKNDVIIPRIYNIEFLRILFTFCIFSCHVCDMFRIVNYGRFSVEFFFILSGFFLYYTIDRQKDLPNFIIKKMIRFLPLMLFGEIVCNLIRHNIFVENYMSLLFFLPGTGLSKVNHCALGTTWYVCVLMWVSVFYFYVIKTQRKATVNISIGIITFLSFVALSKISPVYMKHLFPHYILRGFANMGLGYFLCLIYEKYPKSFTSQKSILFSILEIWLIEYLVAAMFFPESFKLEYIHFVILFLLLILSFLLKRGCISQFFDDDSWGKISKYCLSFFLTHLIIVNYLYSKFIFLTHLSKTVSFLVMFVLSALLSVFAYHVIEKPCASYLRRLFNKETPVSQEKD